MLTKVKYYFHSQREEIFKDSILVWYGLCLALSHALTLYYFGTDTFLFLADGRGQISWPGIPQWFQIHWSGFWNLYFIIWGGIIFLCIWGFIARKKFAYTLLVLSFVMKGFLSFQDYRFMGNYHYMSAILIAIFLFISQKRFLLPFCLVLFYVSAGFLKLNVEWMSGYALFKPPPDYLKVLGVSLYALVVVLELVLSWLLLSTWKWLRWIVLGLFIIFHIISWHWVNYFYPLTMLLALAIFPLSWLLDPQGKILNFSSKLKIWPHGALVLLYCVLQILPKIQPGDSTLTGDGRLWALNMFDAQSICMELSLVRVGNEIWDITNAAGLEEVRIHCDPIIYLDRAEKGCKDLRVSNPNAEIDVFMIAKRRSSESYEPTMRLKSFCSHPANYNLLGWNKWLRD